MTAGNEGVGRASGLTSNTPQYFDTPAAAAYLSLTLKQLERWRSLGCGPAYSKLGRLVRYSRVDLDSWMAARRIQNTAQEAPR